MTATLNSIAAYHSITADRETEEEELLSLYRGHPEGLSDREAKELLGWEAPSVVSARRNGLRKKGLVAALGEKKADTGKQVSVWGLIRETLFD